MTLTMDADPTTYPGDGTPSLAVDLQPDNLAGTFQLDASELDGPDRLGWTDLEAGSWLNIVCDVRSVSGVRGASRTQGVLTRTEAGTVTVVAEDTDGQLDPMTNGDAIHRGTPIRLRAWGFRPLEVDGVESLERWEEVLWTGEVDQLQALYLKGAPAVVTITAMDLVGTLSTIGGEPSAGPDGVGAGDNLHQRVERILADAERGSIGAADPTYAVTLRPSVLGKPWDDVNAAAEAELGQVWVDRYNRLAIRRRNTLTRGVERGTLSDVHGESVVGVHCCVTDALVVYSPELLVNRTVAARRTLDAEDDAAAAVARRDDTYSQARYGPATVERTDLEVQTDDQAASWAQALILGGGTPELRVDTVYPAPSPADLDAALLAWPAVCATDVGDVWAFRFRTHTGVLVAAQLRVMGVAFDLTPEGWTFTWSTTSAPDWQRGAIDAAYFLLDVSELGSGDVLAPFGE